MTEKWKRKWCILLMMMKNDENDDGDEHDDDEKADIKAKTIIQSAFPDRKIIAINGIDISMGGGNVHCITQQQPLSKS